MSTAYLDGSFLPLSEARVPALDRGYLFGDGAYEVIPVYDGRIFRLDAHLARLDYSLGELRIPNPLSRPQWQAVLSRLAGFAPADRQMLYLQVSRGSYAKRAHPMPPEPKPAVFAYAAALPPVPADLASKGVGAVTAEDIRWARCDIKAIALLGHVLLNQQAVDAGCSETLLHREGMVSEGASSNVFIVENDLLVTPPKSRAILAGITRDAVLELAAAEGVTALERPLTLDQLRRADEIWITSSTREIYPVTRLDGQTIGGGQPGPLWSRFAPRFAQMVRR